MTPEEQAAADAAKAKADAEAGNRTYTEAQMKELIAERDKAKEKLRKIDEEKKKLEDQKLIDEGKTKELLSQREAELAEARKEAEEAKQYKTQKREQLLSKLSDDDKEFADGMNLEKLEKFVDKQTGTNNTQQSQSAGKWKPGTGQDKPKFKTAAENAAWLKENGLAV